MAAGRPFRASALVIPSEHRCWLCRALAWDKGAWGPADRLARKLSKRGWAGTYTQLERAWLRSHPPRWWGQQRQNALGGLYAGREMASAPEDGQSVLKPL